MQLKEGTIAAPSSLVVQRGASTEGAMDLDDVRSFQFNATNKAGGKLRA